MFAAALAVSGAARAQELAQAAPAAARAGVAGAVSGQVALAVVPGVRAVGKDVVSGDPIFLGDKITTGPNGRLQIMLEDETTFTLGPKAALTIDRFVYDPSTNAGQVSATILKGTFRFVSGKIAQRDPTKMEVSLPVGSIGVRGTSVAGETDGTRATVVLLGPGAENDAGERIGRILVSGSGPGGSATTVEIVRPGFATQIAGPNVPPSPPVRIDPVRLAALTAPLAGTARPASSSTSPAGSARSSAAAGSTGAGISAARGATAAVLRTAGASAAGSLVGIRSVNNLVVAVQRTALTTASAAQAPKRVIPDGSTTFEQLHTLSGSATITASGVVLNPVTGTGSGRYTYQIVVNFGAQSKTTTVTGSYVLGGASGSINYAKTDSFAGKMGIIGSTSGESLTSANAGLRAGNFGTLTDNPRNVGGKIAAVVDVQLSIFNNSAGCSSSSNCISGARNNVPR
jgi:hypothetical protein